MGMVECARCGKTAEGLSGAPLPGDLGERVLAGTCGACWKEWLDAQVVLINERGLSGANEEHFDYLMSEMQSFLGIGGAGGSGSR